MHLSFVFISKVLDRLGIYMTHCAPRIAASFQFWAWSYWTRILFNFGKYPHLPRLNFRAVEEFNFINNIWDADKIFAYAQKIPLLCGFEFRSLAVRFRELPKKWNGISSRVDSRLGSSRKKKAVVVKMKFPSHDWRIENSICPRNRKCLFHSNNTLCPIIYF